MPHSTEDLVNGDSANGTTTTSSRRSSSGSSHFISHLTSYPVVSDGITTFKEHPYGRKSLQLADDVYTRFGKPVEPYVGTYVVPPYERYAAPYVARADELADSGLARVDARFPIVKEDTNTIVDYGKQMTLFRVLDESCSYVYGTWNDEYNKTATRNDRGPGLYTSLLALISTELKFASDLLARIAEVAGPAYSAGKDKLSKRTEGLRATADSYLNQSDAFRKDVERKASEYIHSGKDRAEAYAQAAADVAEVWRQKAADAIQNGKQEAEKVEGEVREKADEAVQHG